MNCIFSNLFKVTLAISALFMLTIAQPVFANDTKLPQVNVLTWWGYLVNPWVHQMIKDKCHVNISYDEYYSNDEFLRRFSENKNNYNILIFQDSDYGIIKNDIKLNNSGLYLYSKNYQTDVRKHYDMQHYEHNIADFVMEYNALLWNPKQISITNSDTISQIFSKAKSKTVVFSDDPQLVYYLLYKQYDAVSSDQALSDFAHLTKDTKLAITDEYSSMYGRPDFALAYSWSGIDDYAIDSDYKEYKIMINPHYSFVSSDLVAQLDNNPNTACVANVMASKEFLTNMQNDALCFSPYGDSDHITDKIFLKEHQRFFAFLPKLTWLGSMNYSDYAKMNQSWKYFKLKLLSQLNSQ